MAGTELADPKKRFEDLLFAFSQQNNKREFDRIEKTIWDEYGDECATFVLDMSQNFARLEPPQ